MPLARRLRRPGALLAAAVTVPALVAGSASLASATPAAPRWHVRTLVSNPAVQVAGKRFALTGPDDIQPLASQLFVAFQNGVGPQGQAAPDGTRFSTLVDFARSGRIVNHWNLQGHIDGLGLTGNRIVVTVNEDANSSVYRVAPFAPAAHQVTHFAYRPSNPLPHGGGTDDVSNYHGHLLVSASAPGTVPSSVTRAAARPAVYTLRLEAGRVAALRPLFFDGSRATVANTAGPTLTVASPKPAWGTVPAEGSRPRLVLSDPDSSTVVPGNSPRFAGSYVLDSQGDQQLVFAQPRFGATQLSVLDLGQSVDDLAWATRSGGTYYVTDSATDSLVAVTGPIHAGEVLVAATPGDANNPGTASNYVGALNLSSGTVRGVRGLAGLQSAGLVYVAR